VRGVGNDIKSITKNVLRNVESFEMRIAKLFLLTGRNTSKITRIDSPHTVKHFVRSMLRRLMPSVWSIVKPIENFCLRGLRRTTRTTARKDWPTLRISVITRCILYTKSGMVLFSDA
jgi:hypothetical protein